jgi:SagB-type dehydrogenase family enzyme
MKKILFVLLLTSGCLLAQPPANTPTAATIIKLPEPDLNGSISLEQAINNRRSIRIFTPEPLKINQISQLCWAAQGITDPNKGLRAAPSAGALYPIELYVALPDGLYLYLPKNHTLEKKISGDIRPLLSIAAFGQRAVQNSPCTFVIAGSADKVEAKYRGRGGKFIYLEAGHIAQNIHLQAVTLGLGSVPIGAFAPKSVAGICKLPEGLEVLYLVCTGYPIVKSSLEPAVAAAPVYTQPAAPSDDIRKKRVVFIVASQYFDDRQFFGTSEPLQIVGIQPVIASSVTSEVKGIQRNTITPTLLVKDIKVDDFDAFVFIGGPGTKEYFDNKTVLNLVRAANEKSKILAAIDNAPAIFAYADIVKGKKVACFPSQRRKLIDAGAKWLNTPIEIDGNMITSSGASPSQIAEGSSDSARQFGTAILNMLRQQTR